MFPIRDAHTFRACLGTSISQGISIFLWENELIFFGKIEIPWEIGVPKLALKNISFSIV
jgi:hypothetical protein